MGIWSEKLSILWTVCGVLLDLSWSDVSALCHYVFSLSTHLYTVALSILFSSNAFWIMSKVSAWYFQSLRPEFLCIELSISSVLFSPGWYLKHSRVVSDNWSKQLSGKGGLNRNKKFDECKVIMQGNLIAVAYSLRTYWNQFSMSEICKQE